jgi:hypothetical protein
MNLIGKNPGASPVKLSPMPAKAQFSLQSIIKIMVNHLYQRSILDSKMSALLKKQGKKP